MLTKDMDIKPKKQWFHPSAWEDLIVKTHILVKLLFNVNTILPLEFVVELDKILHVSPKPSTVPGTFILWNKWKNTQE